MTKLSLTLTTVIILYLFSCSRAPETGNDAREIPWALTGSDISGRVLTPEILWKFGRLNEYDISPDGNSLVYVVSWYNIKNNERVSDIFTIPVKGGEPVQLTSSDGVYYNARWSPDGERIAYITQHNDFPQIFEMNPDGTGKARISAIDKGINGFGFSPDGSKLFYTKKIQIAPLLSDLHPDLDLASAYRADDLMYRHWGTWNDGSYSHIFVTEYTDKRVTSGKDIMENEPWDAPMAPFFDLSEISWSPDGRYLTYTCKKKTGRDYALSTNSDIYIYDTETGETTNITEGMPGYDRFPVFSPDGEYIAWQSMEMPGFESDKDRLLVMEISTGRKEYISEKLDQNVSNISWGLDGNTIYFISGINATYQIYAADLKTKSIYPVSEGNHNYTSFKIAGGHITGSKMSMSMASELFSIELETGREKQLSFINKPIYDNIQMGKVEERWVKTTDDKKMLVWVIYPPNFDPGKSYPALLYCQGGPQSAVSQFFSFRWNFQLMAANDYIVVAPNRRGLPTFGSEWNNQISGDYGGQNIRDYLSAIDAISKEPFVDENRLGAVGASYGGFSVFFLAGHHQGRFKAFISHCGLFNFESMFAATEETFFVNHDLEGPFWENPKPPSYQFSPHLYINKWDTPILIIAGEKDYRVPYTESIQAFNAARLNEVPARLIVFPDENHWVLKPQNGILWQREFFGWLDQWLK